MGHGANETSGFLIKWTSLMFNLLSIGSQCLHYTSTYVEYPPPLTYKQCRVILPKIYVKYELLYAKNLMFLVLLYVLKLI